MTRAALLRDFVGFTIAVLAVATILAADPPPVAPSATVMATVAAIAAWVAWQDLTDYTIPDGAVAGIALVGVTHRLMAAVATGSGVGDALALVAFDAVLAGGCFLLVREIYFRRRGVDGLGFGDVKLAAASAVLVGATGFALALGAASLAGIAVALLRRPSGGSLAGIKIAFGAVLAPAVALVFAASAVGLAPAWTG